MARITWEKLNDYIDRGIPAVLPLLKRPSVSLVVGRNADNLSLRIACGELTEIEPSPYRELTFELRSVKGSKVFELSTNRKDLFHSFFVFAMAVVDTIDSDSLNAREAVKNSLGKFDIMLMRRSLLSENVQIGLFGELDLLATLIKAKGVGTFTSWLGPLRERHDFRFDCIELEVKSTTSKGRTHIIHGLDQLESSPGKRLWLLSLKYERAGANAGRTLAEQVDKVRQLLCLSSSCLRAFNGYLEQLGYRDMDADFYPAAYQHGGKPTLILVDEKCPRLTRKMLSEMLGKLMTSRIEDVEYRINVDGLGHVEGSIGYNRILPGIFLIPEG